MSTFRGSRSYFDQLLLHLEQYGIVICRSCQFAIQPSALPSHLLRHRIYRNERRELLQLLSRLKLLEPEEVPLPPPNTDPLAQLSVYSGLKCDASGCDHACVSAKRMSQHWSEQHNEHDSRNVRSRPAYLQTFFRGNKIRYFEVNGAGDCTVIQPGSSKKVDSMSTSPPPARDKTPNSYIDAAANPEEISLVDEAALPSLDMQALQYLHHYTVSTSSTLKRRDMGSEDFWKVTIPQQAFRYPFLMFGILGLSAMHKATLYLDDKARSNFHRELAIQYQHSALVDFRSAMRLPDAENSTALIAFGRFFGLQRCVQHQLEWSHPVGPSNAAAAASSMAEVNNNNDDDDDSGISKLLEFFFLMRGGIEMLLSSQHLLQPTSDFALSHDELNAYRELEDRRTLSCDQLASIPLPLLERLNALPKRLAILISQQPSPEFGPEDLTSAVPYLMTAFSISYASDDVWSVWNGAEGWLRNLPDVYIHMLSAGQPGALVIFAHWCLLLKRLDRHYWYTRGQADRLHSIVMENLPSEEWKALIVDLL